MSAREHTGSMLAWWRESGITRADLGVRRADATMVLQSSALLSELPLPWARFENSRGAEVYIRPERTASWPVVLLDDVEVSLARRIAAKYAALCVHTSPKGGCHVWLRCSRSLDEGERRDAQRWLADRSGSDPGSTSGEHFGRLAGFKNQKRGGVWVNVLTASTGPPWQVVETVGVGEASPGSSKMSTRPRGQDLAAGVDCSPSGREWGRTCRALERGEDPLVVHDRLMQEARPRRGKDTERYAARTIEKALAHVREHRT